MSAVMRILVVEDERKTAEYLRKGLGESGYSVDVATNGDDGLHAALSEFYDLVILDVRLPGRDGWSVLSTLRRAGRDTPVLFLTASDAVTDRVKGLESGADDYLVKPFAFSELLARVRSILRRGPVRQPESASIGDLVLDFGKHRVTRAGERIDLTPKEFRLLALLVRRRGEVMSRTLISELVWEMHFDSDTNVVDVAIRRLRAKIDAPFPEKLIRTVRGVGYVIDEN